MNATLDLHSWTSGKGEVRRYVNNWADIIGLEVERYNSGNVRWASLGDDGISNAEANRMLCAKVWIDSHDHVHVDHWAGRAMSAAQVAEIIAVAYAADNAPAETETAEVQTAETTPDDANAMQVISDGAAAGFLLGADTIDTLGEYVALVLGDQAAEFDTDAIEVDLREAIEAELPDGVVLAGAFLYAPYGSTHDWDAVREQLAGIDFWAIAARHEVA